MDTNALKRFAQAARNLLIDQVTAKLAVVVDPASSARRENPGAMQKLDAAIAHLGQTQIIEQVAYTWFNRFTALRFMDVNGYTNPRVVSPEGDATRPELLAEAIAGNLPEGAPATIAALLDGRTPSRDPQGEAYRLLLVHACNAWHALMPFIFEKVGDYTELLMPEDLLSQTSILARLRDAMPEDDCKDVEIIGWLYQFYISEKKDQVFAGLKKKQKITAENIPAATQLFTPHWIVRYLVENSLGRLWLLNRPNSKLAERMCYYIAPEEPETEFLKIGKPEEIKICDPACGSGHMLTYAFDLLYEIYEEEGYEADKIPALILQHNLTGIEIDDRAGALAAFALAMKAAAKLGRRRFLRMEAKPDICVLQNVSFTSSEMQDVLAVVGQDMFTNEFRETLAQFDQSKNCGSLIVPKLRDPAETLRVVEAQDFGGDLILREVQARVIAVLRMAEALTAKYHVVVANPPYMGAKGMNGSLGDFGKANFPDSKSDLFAMFMERALGMTLKRGMMAMINMQSWMFLSSFDELRRKMLADTTFLSMAHLGERAFDTIGGAVVSTTAFVVANSYWPETKGHYVRLVDGSSETEKANMLISAINNQRNDLIFRVPSVIFAEIPGSLITYWLSPGMIKVFSNASPLSDEVRGIQGMITGDNDVFLRYWPELSRRTSLFPPEIFSRASADLAYWVPYTKGGDYRRWYGNGEYLLYWRDEGQQLTRRRSENSDLYFQECVSWNKISTRNFAARYLPVGYVWDVAGSSIFPNSQYSAKFYAGLMGSIVAQHILTSISPTLNFEMETILGFPLVGDVFKRHHDVVRISDSIIQLARSDWDSYEISWDFTTLPLLSLDHRGSTLEATYSRVRNHWRCKTDEMQRLEAENNRIFIDAYGLQKELSPEVPIEEITLTCNPAYRYGVKGAEDERETRLLADTIIEFVSYAVGCMFGRYSLDAPGLILANQGETLADYLARVPEPSFLPDEDNVITVLDADWFPDDIVDRFRKFLRVTFGEEHFRENLAFIEAQIGDIRRYFIKDFYDDHVKRYKKRPIYWMFASPKGTFQALIYMHRYRPDTVSVLLNDYLREFIRKLEAERDRLEKLTDDPTATQTQRTRALKDVATVAKQIAELEEWERDVIFPLAQAKVEIDLDDGVKRNYPLFGAALKPIKGLEAADE